MSVQKDDVRPAVGSVHAYPRGRCWHSVTSLPSPEGDIVVLRVAGEIDVATVAFLQRSLSSVFSRGPAHLVADLAGVTFCCARGLAVIVETAGDAAARGIGYAVSGAAPQADRIWALLWPADQVPTRYPTARDGVLAAMTRQAGIHDRLTERVQAGDTAAHRTLARRRRTAMYRRALEALDASENVAPRLRAALAVFP